MITTDKIASKLINDGFRYGMAAQDAINILNHCVAPVACVKLFKANVSEVFERVGILEFAPNVTITKISHDVNGNPRYVVHFLEFIKEADEHDRLRRSWPENSDLLHGQFYLALGMARKIGGKIYRGKDLKGGIVFQSFNVHELREDIAKLRFTGKI